MQTTNSCPDSVIATIALVMLVAFTRIEGGAVSNCSIVSASELNPEKVAGGNMMFQERALSYCPRLRKRLPALIMAKH